MIKIVVLDVDGVITDGTVLIDSAGKEQKKINLKDIDAIFELHHMGYKLAAITGEDSEIVDYFEKKFPWNYFYRGNKNKKEALKEIIEKENIKIEEVCYMGDGKYDVEVLKRVGLGLCPADAIARAKDAADIILQKAGGNGCIWELIDILERNSNEDEGQNYFRQRIEEHASIFKEMEADAYLGDIVQEVGNQMIQIFQNQGAVYLCGNGGSAADAQHIATEFISRFYKERAGLNAEALSVNTSTITAVGNDYDFDRIFARQIEAKGKSGDMLIGFSTSGKSKNVLEAFKYCNSKGIKTVLFTGLNGKSVLKEAADYIISVPSLVTPRIQEAHIFIGHVLAEYVENKMFGE